MGALLLQRWGLPLVVLRLERALRGGDEGGRRVREVEAGRRHGGPAEQDEDGCPKEAARGGRETASCSGQRRLHAVVAAEGVGIRSRW